MTLAKGDRVVLRRDGREALGTVLGREVDGLAYVRLDGGPAANYPVTDLHPAQAKAWPPAVETK